MQLHRIGADAGDDAPALADDRVAAHDVVRRLEEVVAERLEARVLGVAAREDGVEEVEEFGAVRALGEFDVHGGEV